MYRLTEKGRRKFEVLDGKLQDGSFSEGQDSIVYNLLGEFRSCGNSLEAVKWAASGGRGEYLDKVLSEFCYLVDKGYIEEV